MRRAALIGSVLTATALVLLQLVATVYSIKDFWLVAVRALSLWREIFVPQLKSAGIWSILLSTIECLVLVLVLALTLLRPRSVWKAYLASAALGLVSLQMSYGVLLAQVPEHLQSAVALGHAFSLLCTGLTLALLVAVAKLTVMEKNALEAANRV